MMKTLLFIGGTSFFGKLAVRQLIEAGKHRVTLLTRSSQLPEELSPAVSHIRCDRTDGPAMKAALTGKQFDIVVDNIANDGRDVRTVLDLLGGQLEHYVLCSSATVYPQWHTLHSWSESEAVLEPVLSQIPFANDKREAEKQLGTSNAVPYTIIRPTVIEGPDDPVRRTGFFVEEIYRQRKFVIPDDVVLQHAYVDDVADALVSLIARGPTNRAYNICGSDCVPLPKYCDAIAELLKKHPCYEVVSRDEFTRIRSDKFPIIFDQTLLLSNALLRKTIRYEPTPIDRWLPITVKWNQERLK